MKYLVLCLAIFLAVCSSARADEKVDAAIRALDALEADAGKLQGYCAILKEMFAAGEDEAKNEALEAKMEAVSDHVGSGICGRVGTRRGRRAGLG